MPPRAPPTHFLCIPLVSGASRHQLSASLASFTADVTSADSFGVPEQAIRPVGTLHLTLGVMSFPKNEGLERAVTLLNSLVPRKILANVKTASTAIEVKNGEQSRAEKQQPPGPPRPLLSVTLKGLHAMASASKTSILYARPVDDKGDEGTLKKFCESLRSTFQEAGLMVAEDRPLLLHATILNTIYVKRGNGPRGGNQGKRKRHEKLTVDARGMLERYTNFVWMQDVPIEKIAICRMGAKKQDDGDEVYEVEAEIDLV